MYHKKCTECDRTSHSATKKGKWICPYCNTDLTEVNVLKRGK